MQKVLTWGHSGCVGRPQGDGVMGQVVGIPENETISKVIYAHCTKSDVDHFILHATSRFLCSKVLLTYQLIYSNLLGQCAIYDLKLGSGNFCVTYLTHVYIEIDVLTISET